MGASVSLPTLRLDWLTAPVMTRVHIGKEMHVSVPIPGQTGSSKNRSVLESLRLLISVSRKLRHDGLGCNETFQPGADGVKLVNVTALEQTGRFLGNMKRPSKELWPFREIKRIELGELICEGGHASNTLAALGRDSSLKASHTDLISMVR